MILIDKHINAGHHPHTLLLTLDDALLQFLILDKDGRPIWAFGQSMELDLDEHRPESMVIHFKKALSARFSPADFKKVSIAFNSPLYTLVPQSLDQLEDKQKYFDQIGYLSPREVILNDQIPDQKACLYYSIHQQYKKALEQIFPDAQFLHYVSGFLKNKIYGDRDYVLAHVLQKKVIYFVYKKGQLHQVSSFTMEVKDDFLYYINTLYRMHDLDREEVALVLTGHIYPDAPMVGEMRNYIRLVRFSTELDVSDKEIWKALDRPAHYFYDFQLLHKCA